MKALMKIAAVAAGALMVTWGSVPPAAAGDWGKKYRGHSHHKWHWHGRHRGFGHGKVVRRVHRHRYPAVRYVYVTPPRQVTIVQPYVPPPMVSVRPPGTRILSATCREYTNTVMIDGQPVSAYGRACLQPDGSWRLVPME